MDFCKKLLRYKWTSDQLNTFVLTFFQISTDQHWSGKKWGQKCSTGQRFVCTEVTSYKIHILNDGSKLYFDLNFLPTVLWTQILNGFSKSAFSYFDPRVTYFWHSDISAFWLCSLRVATWLYFMVSDISIRVTKVVAHHDKLLTQWKYR